MHVYTDLLYATSLEESNAEFDFISFIRCITWISHFGFHSFAQKNETSH